MTRSGLSPSQNYAVGLLIFGKVVIHGRYVAFQMAEATIPRIFFANDRHG